MKKCPICGGTVQAKPGLKRWFWDCCSCTSEEQKAWALAKQRLGPRHVVTGNGVLLEEEYSWNVRPWGQATGRPHYVYILAGYEVWGTDARIEDVWDPERWESQEYALRVVEGATPGELAAHDAVADAVWKAGTLMWPLPGRDPLVAKIGATTWPSERLRRLRHDCPTVTLLPMMLRECRREHCGFTGRDRTKCLAEEDLHEFFTFDENGRRLRRGGGEWFIYCESFASAVRDLKKKKTISCLCGKTYSSHEEAQCHVYRSIRQSFLRILKQSQEESSHPYPSIPLREAYELIRAVEEPGSCREDSDYSWFAKRAVDASGCIWVGDNLRVRCHSFKNRWFVDSEGLKRALSMELPKVLMR